MGFESQSEKPSYEQRKNDLIVEKQQNEAEMEKLQNQLTRIQKAIDGEIQAVISPEQLVTERGKIDAEIYKLGEKNRTIQQKIHEGNF